MTAIPAINDRSIMLVPRAWSQWVRNDVLYRQYHHDDGSATVLARIDETWFVLRPDGAEFRWVLQSPQMKAS